MSQDNSYSFVKSCVKMEYCSILAQQLPVSDCGGSFLFCRGPWCLVKQVLKRR